MMQSLRINRISITLAILAVFVGVLIPAGTSQGSIPLPEPFQVADKQAPDGENDLSQDQEAAYRVEGEAMTVNASQQSVEASLSSDASVVAPGDTFAVVLNVSGAPDSGQFEIAYNSNVVSLENASWTTSGSTQNNINRNPALLSFFGGAGTSTCTLTFKAKAAGNPNIHIVDAVAGFSGSTRDEEVSYSPASVAVVVEDPGFGQEVSFSADTNYPHEVNAGESFTVEFSLAGDQSQVPACAQLEIGFDASMVELLDVQWGISDGAQGDYFLREDSVALTFINNADQTPRCTLTFQAKQDASGNPCIRINDAIAGMSGDVREYEVDYTNEPLGIVISPVDPGQGEPDDGSIALQEGQWLDLDGLGNSAKLTFVAPSDGFYSLWARDKYTSAFLEASVYVDGVLQKEGDLGQEADMLFLRGGQRLSLDVESEPRGQVRVLLLDAPEMSLGAWGATASAGSEVFGGDGPGGGYYLASFEAPESGVYVFRCSDKNNGSGSIWSGSPRLRRCAVLNLNCGVCPISLEAGERVLFVGDEWFNGYVMPLKAQTREAAFGSEVALAPSSVVHYLCQIGQAGLYSIGFNGASSLYQEWSANGQRFYANGSRYFGTGDVVELVVALGAEDEGTRTVNAFCELAEGLTELSLGQPASIVPSGGYDAVFVAPYDGTFAFRGQTNSAPRATADLYCGDASFSHVGSATFYPQERSYEYQLSQGERVYVSLKGAYPGGMEPCPISIGFYDPNDPGQGGEEPGPEPTEYVLQSGSSVDVTVPSGEYREVRFTAPSEGVYRFYSLASGNNFFNADVTFYDSESVQIGGIYQDYMSDPSPSYFERLLNSGDELTINVFFEDSEAEAGTVCLSCVQTSACSTAPVGEWVNVDSAQMTKFVIPSDGAYSLDVACYEPGYGSVKFYSNGSFYDAIADIDIYSGRSDSECRYFSEGQVLYCAVDSYWDDELSASVRVNPVDEMSLNESVRLYPTSSYERFFVAPHAGVYDIVGYAVDGDDFCVTVYGSNSGWLTSLGWRYSGSSSSMYLQQGEQAFIRAEEGSAAEIVISEREVVEYSALDGEVAVEASTDQAILVSLTAPKAGWYSMYVDGYRPPVVATWSIDGAGASRYGDSYSTYLEEGQTLSLALWVSRSYETSAIVTVRGECIDDVPGIDLGQSVQLDGSRLFDAYFEAPQDGTYIVAASSAGGAEGGKWLTLCRNDDSISHVGYLQTSEEESYFTISLSAGEKIFFNTNFYDEYTGQSIVTVRLSQEKTREYTIYEGVSSTYSIPAETKAIFNFTAPADEPYVIVVDGHEFSVVERWDYSTWPHKGGNSVSQKLEEGQMLSVAVPNATSQSVRVGVSCYALSDYLPVIGLNEEFALSGTGDFEGVFTAPRSGDYVVVVEDPDATMGYWDSVELVEGNFSYMLGEVSLRGGSIAKCDVSLSAGQRMYVSTNGNGGAAKLRVIEKTSKLYEVGLGQTINLNLTAESNTVLKFTAPEDGTYSFEGIASSVEGYGCSNEVYASNTYGDGSQPSWYRASVQGYESGRFLVNRALSAGQTIFLKMPNVNPYFLNGNALPMQVTCKDYERNDFADNEFGFRLSGSCWIEDDGTVAYAPGYDGWVCREYEVDYGDWTDYEEEWISLSEGVNFEFGDTIYRDFECAEPIQPGDKQGYIEVIGENGLVGHRGVFVNLKYVNELADYSVDGPEWTEVVSVFGQVIGDQYKVGIYSWIDSLWEYKYLQEGTDYTVSYYAVTRDGDQLLYDETAPVDLTHAVAGEYVAVAEGIAPYRGKVEAGTFFISNCLDISSSDCELRHMPSELDSELPKFYGVFYVPQNGNRFEGARNMVQGRDFLVTGYFLDGEGAEPAESIEQPGTYYAKLVGMGDYCGMRFIPFAVVEKSSVLDLSKERIFMNAISRSVSSFNEIAFAYVSNGQHLLVEGQDYIVQYFVDPFCEEPVDVASVSLGYDVVTYYAKLTGVEGVSQGECVVPVSMVASNSVARCSIGNPYFDEQGALNPPKLSVYRADGTSESLVYGRDYVVEYYSDNSYSTPVYSAQPGCSLAAIVRGINNWGGTVRAEWSQIDQIVAYGYLGKCQPRVVGASTISPEGVFTAPEVALFQSAGDIWESVDPSKYAIGYYEVCEGNAQLDENGLPCAVGRYWAYLIGTTDDMDGVCRLEFKAYDSSDWDAAKVIPAGNYVAPEPINGGKYMNETTSSLIAVDPEDRGNWLLDFAGGALNQLREGIDYLVHIIFLGSVGDYDQQSFFMTMSGNAASYDAGLQRGDSFGWINELINGNPMAIVHETVYDQVYDAVYGSSTDTSFTGGGIELEEGSTVAEEVYSSNLLSDNNPHNAVGVKDAYAYQDYKDQYNNQYDGLHGGTIVENPDSIEASDSGDVADQKLFQVVIEGIGDYEGLQLTTLFRDKVPSERTKKFELGDLNMDGVIDLKDQVLLHRGLANLELLSADQLTLSDMDADGDVDKDDLKALAKLILEKSAE